MSVALLVTFACLVALAVAMSRHAPRLVNTEASASLASAKAASLATAQRQRDAAVDAEIARLPMTSAATDLVRILRRHGAAVAVVEMRNGTPHVCVDGIVPAACSAEIARESQQWPRSSVALVLGAWRLFR